MSVLVTGSSGHLGEALIRTLRQRDVEVVGMDVKASPTTDVIGSVDDAVLVAQCLGGIRVVYHTATLHKPHVATHAKRAFVDTNITGTLTLLEAAVKAGVRAFVFTSTTSVFGDAMRPGPGEPAVWVTEDVLPAPRNIYSTTKVAAESLCSLMHREHGLPCIILRTSRFFPEADDNAASREAFDDANLKVNEYLFRRVDVEDVVSAHLIAAERAGEVGFGTCVVSATSPFVPDDLPGLRHDVSRIVERHVPGTMDLYRELGWSLPRDIGRVYVNQRARSLLGWVPRYDFAALVRRLTDGESHLSPLARAIGRKGYHDEVFDEGPYPVLPDPEH